MFKTDLSRITLSAVGAFFFTAVTVGAAVAPAHMVETGPVVYAAAAPQVGGGINA